MEGLSISIEFNYNKEAAISKFERLSEVILFELMKEPEINSTWLIFTLDAENSMRLFSSGSEKTLALSKTTLKI